LPLGTTTPLSGCPPSITNFSIRLGVLSFFDGETRFFRNYSGDWHFCLNLVIPCNFVTGKRCVSCRIL
jgi:hypothetical protein